MDSALVLICRNEVFNNGIKVKIFINSSYIFSFLISLIAIAQSFSGPIIILKQLTNHYEYNYILIIIFVNIITN